MIRDATTADLPLILDILRRASDAPYDAWVVAEEKCFGRGFSGEPRTRLYGERGLAVTCGRYLRMIAVDRESRGRGIGSALLEDSRATIIGAEPGNYFLPGTLESDAAFFLKRGFRETAATWNLHSKLEHSTFTGGSTFDLRPSTFGARPAPAGLRIMSIHSETGGLSVPDSPKVEGRRSKVDTRSKVDAQMLAFIEREFGKIWAFEAARATAAVWIPDVGFAVVEANNKGLGTFGPTGVARQHRGKGHGRALLLAALAQLARKGYREAVIPWTDAIEFYRRSCGAEPAHRFVTLTAC